MVTLSDINNAPYVAATEQGRLIATTGVHVYARGDMAGSRYSIYRPGKRLVDPDTEEVYGLSLIHISEPTRPY